MNSNQQQIFEPTTDQHVFPVITLYQPWATWIMRGWKPVETRMHNRFKTLVSKTVLIHAGQNNDKSDAAVNNPYLTKEQLLYKPEEFINGYILGSVFVFSSGLLGTEDEEQALIECQTERFGLFLKDIKPFAEPIPEKGEMGIWYFNTQTKQKVRK